jgi:hypothetical protein
MENFKTAFLGDINLWSSRHYHPRYRHYRRHRHSQSKVEKKKSQMLVMVTEMTVMLKRDLPFVGSFIRSSFVRSSFVRSSFVELL